eukprot:gb/GECG01003271.1/.p1 GENE.gb/GECG01003271.1/~~gb/GECG01003271.1/.p1  ORF type:complete len:344 (+),score=49.66 gb/GECG01003271.1/:1-1032(+)
MSSEQADESVADRGPSSVPEPWTAVWDDNYERYFYYHPKKHISTWFHPVLDVQEEEDLHSDKLDNEEATGSNVDDDDETSVEADEYGWIECFDERYKLPYWFNVFTESSTWYKPPEVESSFSDAELKHQKIRANSEASRRDPTPRPVQAPPNQPLNPIPDPATYGFTFPDIDSLPPPPRIEGTTKVYPSVVASGGLDAPRYFIDTDLKLDTGLSENVKSSKYGVMFKCIGEADGVNWTARWFALNGTSLRYFKSHEEYPNNPLDGIKVYGSKIHAYKKPVKVSEDVDECTGFSLLESDGERVVDLALQSQKLCEDWINALCRKGAKVIDDNTIVESLSLLSHS